ncbi:hypothetical protein [Streptomyces longispororuber]
MSATPFDTADGDFPVLADDEDQHTPRAAMAAPAGGPAAGAGR